jgi:hypothetical protein
VASVLDRARELARNKHGGSALLGRTVRFEHDFRDLIEGVVDDSARVHRIAKARWDELHQVQHGSWIGHTGLEDRWYESVERGDPDYGVYAEDDYLGDCWAGWLYYSRESLRKLCPANSLQPEGVLADMRRLGVSTVTDLGCGMGLTTAALTELFPDSEIVGTNVSGCAQYSVAERLGDQYGFSMVPTVQAVGHPCDVVIASEYFEHFETPIEHLVEVLDALEPRAMVIANAFNVSSIGHFPAYFVDGEHVSGPATARAFNTTMRKRGYQKIPTTLWNNRPSYWKRVD